MNQKIEKILKKLEKKKMLEKELALVKEDKSKLEEELRSVHKEKAEDKEKYLRLKEEKIKMQSIVKDLENKIDALIKDNKTLEDNMKSF